jgi:hypothetical protein
VASTNKPEITHPTTREKLSALLNCKPPQYWAKYIAYPFASWKESISAQKMLGKEASLELPLEFLYKIRSFITHNRYTTSGSASEINNVHPHFAYYTYEKVKT